MQNVELQHYAKDTNVSTKDVHELSDSDVQQVTAKNYDPVPDQRDMRRLGKRQVLKVRTAGVQSDVVSQLMSCSDVSASSPSSAT